MNAPTQADDSRHQVAGSRAEPARSAGESAALGDGGWLPTWGLILGVVSVPGVLAGTLIAGLLFFLNFHWRTDLGPWFRTVAIYSSLLGCGGLVLQLPFFWGAPSRAARWLPWALSLTFFLFGVLFWRHASVLALYLPPGINRRLIKAGLLLLSAAVITLLVTLSHVLQKRRYSWKSRGALLALCCLAVYVVVERREAYEPLAENPPRPFFSETPAEPRTVVVVGVAALTLDVVLPLAEQGRLPFFAELAREGASGRLRTIRPSRTEAAWWSLATGALPYRLGPAAAERYAADFIEPGETFRLTPIGLSFERWGVAGGELPASPEEPAVPPIWQLVRRQGSSSRVIGFASEPQLVVDLVQAGGDGDISSEGSRDAAITDTARDNSDALPAQTQLANAALTRREQLLSAMSSEDLALAEVDGQRVALTRVELRETPGNQNGLFFVRLDGLAPLSRETYGAFTRVELRGRRDAELVAAAARLVAYYSVLDDWLRELWSALQERPGGVSLVVVSPFGATPSSSIWDVWRAVWPERLLEGRTDDGADGVLLARGDVWRPGRIEEVTVRDLAPTVAYLFGLPIAQDLSGEVLIRALQPDFLRRNPLRYVPSYGRVPAPPLTSLGVRPSAAALDELFVVEDSTVP